MNVDECCGNLSGGYCSNTNDLKRETNFYIYIQQ